MVRQTFSGLVISTGLMNKTIKVRVQHVKFNRLISKDVIQYKDFMVHDELNKCKEGDIVRIQYVRPLSAKKRFAVSEIMMDKGTEWLKYQQEAPVKVAQEELVKLEQYTKERDQRAATQAKSVVASDLRSLDSLMHQKDKNNDPELARNIELLKNKYGIENWPPTHEIIKLDMDKLRGDLSKLEIEVTKKTVVPRVDELLQQEPAKADEILTSLGKNTAGMKSGIKRNILLKHFAKSFS